MRTLLAPLIWLLLAGALSACQVPVFRFALERWPADPFRLLASNDGPFDAPLQAALTSLQDSLAANPPPLNLTLETIDLATLSEAARISLPGLEHLGAGPSFLLLPPASWQSKDPVWSGPANVENLALLRDSPARQRCAAHLLAGESAVWLLVLSGDPAQDDQALSLLAEGLQKAAATIEVPPGVIRREDLNRDLANIDLDDVLRSDLPLKISFVTETVSRQDPAEALFLATLIGPSRPPANEPLVVPIFGRGRTPGPLPASRLTIDRLVAACEYLCGSCSCQVKQGNPGYDLLFQTNWDKLLNPTVLTADSEIVQQALDVVRFGDEPAAPPTQSSAEPPPLGPMMISCLAAIALFFGALGGIFLWQRRKHSPSP